MSKNVVKVSVVGKPGVFWADFTQKKPPKRGSSEPRIPVYSETGSKPVFSAPMNQIIKM